MDKDIEKILFTNEENKKRQFKKLGKKLTEDYHDKNPVIVGILRGAAPFMIDLIQAWIAIWEIDFMAVSSYGDDTKIFWICKNYQKIWTLMWQIDTC